MNLSFSVGLHQKSRFILIASMDGILSLQNHFPNQDATYFACDGIQQPP